MLVIQRGRPEDASAVLRHLNLVGAETDNLTFGKEGFPATVEQEAQWLEARAHSEKSAFFAAWEDGQIVGECSLEALPRRMAHRAELGISVQRACWGRGVGSKLLEAAIAFGKAHGIEQIELYVRSGNARAIALYRKFGFQKLCVCPGFFKLDGRYIDADTMLLDLRAAAPGGNSDF